MKGVSTVRSGAEIFAAGRALAVPALLSASSAVADPNTTSGRR